MVGGPHDRIRVHDALIDLCVEHRFDQISVEALCERAGIDRLAFEFQFANLDNCFLMVFEMEVERFHDLWASACRGLIEWRDRLRATAYVIYRYLGEDERIVKFIAVEARSAAQPVQLLFAKMLGELFELIDEGRLQLDDPDSLTGSTAESVGGGIFNQLYLALESRSPVPVEGDLVPKLMYAAVLPYLGSEAALAELRIPPPPHPGD